MIQGGGARYRTEEERSEEGKVVGIKHREAAGEEEPILGTFAGMVLLAKEAADSVEVLATLNGQIVAAKQRNILALSFHPELTKDRRIHHYFLGLVS